MLEAVPVAFRSIDQKPGLQIWTIEKMKMVPIPSQAYGNFFEGDCYIVLCGRQSSSQLSFDVHYWIGSQSSQDEQGATAILVTQLDNYLGGSPIQYREVQDCESVKFKSYFKNGIVFNVGDIFLLDMGKVIVQWNGPESNHPERLKDIRDRERGGRAQIGVVDGDNEAASPELMKIMTAVLGQRTGSLKPATPDNRPDLYQKSNVRLYHVSDSSGNLVIQEIATQPLTQDLLSSDDCYIVDQGGVKIFVWKGKNATTQERQAGLGRAEGFIKAKNYPSTTNVEIMNEDAESSMFKQLFKTWTEKGLTQGLGKTHAGLQASQDEITASAYQAVNLDNKYNGEPVQVRVTMTKEPRHFLAIFKGKLIIYQGGTGRGGKAAQDPAYRLFQVRGTDEYNTKASEVPARASSLNTNDVFVLRADHVCYLWCGKGCSGDERERAKSVADIVSKRDKQTILEGQEPTDFWVALGGKAPYCSDKRFQEEKPQRVPRLFECSNQTGRFMMTEVFDFAQEDLDEEDVMLLDTWEEIFLWIGKAANNVEKKESLTSAAEYLKTHPAQRDPGTPVTTVTQGHEPLTFTGWFSAWDPHKWSDSRSYEDIKNSLGEASAISQITVDLNKTDLNKEKGGASKSPASGYRAPGGPSTPLDTATKNKPHSVSTDKIDGRSPAAPNGRTTGYDPELLINKTAEELPEGVDPSRKEIFAGFQPRSRGAPCLLVFNPGPGEPRVCWFSTPVPGSPVSAGFQPRSRGAPCLLVFNPGPGEPRVCWFSTPVPGSPVSAGFQPRSRGAPCLLVFNPGPGEPRVCWFSTPVPGSPVSAGFQPRSRGAPCLLVFNPGPGEPRVCWFSTPVPGSPVSAGFQPRSRGAPCLLVFNPGPGEPRVCWFSTPVPGSPVSAGFQPRSRGAPCLLVFNPGPGEPRVCWFSTPVPGSPVSAGFQPRSRGAPCLLVFNPGPGEPRVCWFSTPVPGSPVSAGFQPRSRGAPCLLVFNPGPGEPRVCWFSTPVPGSPVSAGFQPRSRGAPCLLVFNPGPGEPRVCWFSTPVPGSPVSAGFQPRSRGAPCLLVFNPGPGEPRVCWFSTPVPGSPVSAGFQPRSRGAPCLLVFNPGPGEPRVCWFSTPVPGSPVSAGFQPRSRGAPCLLVFNPGPGEPRVCWFSTPVPGSPVSAGFQPRSRGAPCLLVFNPGPGEPRVCWFSTPVPGSPVSAGFQPRSRGAPCLLVFNPGPGEPRVCWFSTPGPGSPVSAGFHSS
ncbi:UNVERIFIED_CONTAM: hypothetical protein FKN15_072310 [Acipenser sinensis]